ncbi:MAG TPA: GNAT family N-acetyltransferase [Lacipirellulaceae bacterium]|jgi:RimJ/RimL family protein N-acetyltransferase
MQTARLEFVPHTPQGLRALIDGYDEFADKFGIPAAVGLREFFVSGDISADWLAKLAAATGADPWTFGFAIVHRADRLVIGSGGFKGPPTVEDAFLVCEIAYGIAPGYRCQGFATETAQALVDYAIASGRVGLVRAHTLPEPNASSRVLTKCGFKKIGGVVDPEDGLVWRWERNIGN